MAGKGKFEDLEVWQEARKLANRIYDLSGGEAFERDFGLRDQIRRAAVSVLSNIAEGHERDSDAEFGRFLAIAKGSVGEVRAQLYVARDRNYVGETEFRDAKTAAESPGRRIARFISYLKQPVPANPSPKRTPTARSPYATTTLPPGSADVWDF